MIDLGTYGVTVVGDCAVPECGATLIPRKQWQNLTPDQRAELLDAGVTRKQARDMCARCYERASKAGVRDEYPRKLRPSEWMIEDYQHIKDDLPVGASRKRRLSVAAPRLGVTVGALDMCLRRHRVAA